MRADVGRGHPLPSLSQQGGPSRRRGRGGARAQAGDRRGGPRRCGPGRRGLRVRAALHRSAQLLAGHHLRASVADERDGTRPDGPASPSDPRAEPTCRIGPSRHRGGRHRRGAHGGAVDRRRMRHQIPQTFTAFSRVRVGRASSRPPRQHPATHDRLPARPGFAPALRGSPAGRRETAPADRDRWRSPGKKGPTTCGNTVFTGVRSRRAGPGNLGRLIRAFTPMSHCCNVHLIVYCVTTVQDASCGA